MLTKGHPTLFICLAPQAMCLGIAFPQLTPRPATMGVSRSVRPTRRGGAAPGRLQLSGDPGRPLRVWVWLVVVVAMLASGCASRGGYYKDDGPPARHPVDIHSIPDAVPRNEPLSDTGNNPYIALGRRYVPMSSPDGYRKRGTASWYGKKFHGKRTSSGEKYDMYKMTAAHRTLPIPSYARVTNLRNGESVVVRVNDRGPFLRNRLVDLSYAAAYKLGIIATGTGYVEVRSITTGPEGIASADSSRSTGAPIKDLTNDADRFYVQFGAFTQSANAKSLMRKLQQIGIGFAHIQHGDDGYFRVRSGPFSSSATAEHFLIRGADLGLSTTIVMEQ